MHDEESPVAHLLAQEDRVIRRAPENISARMRAHFAAIRLAEDVFTHRDKCFQRVAISFLKAKALIGDRDPRAPHREQCIFLSDAA